MNEARSSCSKFEVEGCVSEDAAITARDISEHHYEALLHLARQGDARALGQLLQAELGWLKGMIRLQCGNTSALPATGVDDLAQECVLRCLGARSTLRSRSRTELRGRLRLITLNIFRSRLRRPREVPHERGEEARVPPSDERHRPSQAIEAGDALREALCGLPAHLAATVLLHDFCRCEHEKVAWLLGSASAPAAQRMRYRALQALRPEAESR